MHIYINIYINLFRYIKMNTYRCRYTYMHTYIDVKGKWINHGTVVEVSIKLEVSTGVTRS
jgi:hypothetical protein